MGTQLAGYRMGPIPDPNVSINWPNLGNTFRYLNKDYFISSYTNLSCSWNPSVYSTLRNRFSSYTRVCVHVAMPWKWQKNDTPHSKSTTENKPSGGPENAAPLLKISTDILHVVDSDLTSNRVRVASRVVFVIVSGSDGRKPFWRQLNNSKMVTDRPYVSIGS